MEKINVLFAVFEAVPFIKTGGLGDIGGSLPAAVNKAGGNMRVILPKFQSIPEEYKAKMQHVADFRVPLGWRSQYCGIETLKLNGVQYYFIDNEYYFKREAPYGYYDDGERIAFFAKAVLESLQHLPDFFPQILHCNDWHTALTPVFLREQYMEDPRYRQIRTVFTVHNLKFQGIFPEFCLGDILGLQDSKAARDQLIRGDTINYMRGALRYSDRLTTVSPSYAQEICTEFYGEKADDIFRDRRSVLSGILNGIDTAKYDPRTDPALAANFNLRNWKAKKRENKEQLQRELGLTVNGDLPLIALISRLTGQKGLDLVNYIMPELMRADVQFAVLGVGEQRYEDAFRYFASAFPGKAAACIRFDEGLSHRFYAGSDMILVPSLFEPCGLTQMIAMRYATLPVVRETGGLRDSVVPYNKYTGEGNGFSFANFNAHELLQTIWNALDLYYNDRPDWDRLALQAMHADFSWKKSAGAYLALYEDLLRE